ncbi:MAG: DUF4292 domain-containing protein [Flammeovirgaceae bacterium]|nr:DUF4292 domain-containing protein [Flammeovirgaceae bacterium]
MKPYLFVILLLFVAACSKPTAEEVIDKSIVRIADQDTIKTIIAIADCRGPNGAYETEVHSAANDYVYFKQVYSYREEIFEAVGLSPEMGFQMKDSLKFSALSKNTIHALHSHEFHSLLFDLKNRFHDFSDPQVVVVNDTATHKIAALDALNNPVEIFINAKTSRLTSILMRNPDQPDEVISFTYSDWGPVQGVTLPMHVEIDQNGKKFTFDFTSVVINPKEFKRIKDLPL